MKVLVVDNEKGFASILADHLKMKGIDAGSVYSGRDALAAVSDFRPDVIILDIQMPAPDGYTLARMIRHEIPGIGPVPLLAYTSSTDRNAQRCKEAGFDAFLTKPTRREILFKTIEKLLSSEDQARTAKTSTEAFITQYSVREEIKQSVRILLAEDNPVNQKLAVLILTKAGYNIEVAANGRQAVEAFSAKPDQFDLILMDVQMPEMDGLAATRVLRDKGFTSVPIIAMTANAMKGDREICLEAGMNDYISKPIKREVVFEIIEKWLHHELGR